MAYGVKYRFTPYCHALGDIAWQVDLAQKDYVGAIDSSLEMAPEGFAISREGSGGTKFYTSNGNVTKGTSATLTCLVENSTDRDAFLAIAQGAEDEWKMLIYKAGVLQYELMVLPDVFTFPYEDYPYQVSVKAIDELGRLSAIPFMNGASFYTQTNSISYYLFECLDKLTIQRSIRESIYIYAENMNSTSTDSVLAQASVVPTKYKNNTGQEDESAWSCLEVINDMLKPFGAILRLAEGNKWHITRVNLLGATSYGYLELSNYNTVASTGTITNNTQTNINTDSTIKTFIESPQVKVDWRWKRVSLKFNVGEGADFIPNGDLGLEAWNNVNDLKAFTEFYAPPLYDFSWEYERVLLNETAYYADTTTYTISVTATEVSGDYVSITGPATNPFTEGDQVIFNKDIGATMPAGINDNRPYYVINPQQQGDVYSTNRIQLATSPGGSVVSITAVGTGAAFVSLAQEKNIEYAVRLPDHQNTNWTSGSMTNNNGITSDAVGILAQAGNTFSISFFWHIRVDPELAFQSNPAYGYYGLTLRDGATTTHWYNSTTQAWVTSAHYNALDDTSLRFPWIKETITDDFPADGMLELTFYQASSPLLNVTSIDIASIETEILLSGNADLDYILKTGEVSANYAYNAETIELYSGDAPASTFDGNIGLTSTLLSNNWSRTSHASEDRELLDILLQSYLNNYGRTTLKVNGTFMGDVGPDEVINDSYLDYTDAVEGSITPKLMLLGGTFNVEAGTWSGEWAEVRE